MAVESAQPKMFHPNAGIGKEVMGDGLAISNVLLVGTNNTFPAGMEQERQSRALSAWAACVS